MYKHSASATPRTSWDENDQRAARGLAGGPHRSAHSDGSDPVPVYAPVKAQSHVAGIMRAATENLEVVI